MPSLKIGEIFGNPQKIGKFLKLAVALILRYTLLYKQNSLCCDPALLTVKFKPFLIIPFFFFFKRRLNGILLEPRGKFFKGYDSDMDATTFNSLASAAFRMGHSLIRETFGQFNKYFTRLGEVSVTRFFDPSSLYKLENNGIDGLNLGLVREQAQQFDR